MADHPSSAPNVEPIYSSALLGESKIPAKPLVDMLNRLREELRGLIRSGGSIEQFARRLEGFLWAIARGATYKELVASVDELATTLAEVDQELQEAQARPATAMDTERVAALERNLAEARTALAELRAQHGTLEAQQRDTAAALEAERAGRTSDQATAATRESDLHRDLDTERAGRTTDRTAHDERIAALTHELDSERAARQAAERVRLDDFRAALAALRTESTGATQAIAALADLAAKAGAAHDAVTAAIDAMGGMTTTDSGLHLTAARARLVTRLRTLNGHLDEIQDAISRAEEERAELPDEERRLQAVQRTAGGTAAAEAARQLIAIAARQRQLEEYSDGLVQLKAPAEQERDGLNGLVDAIDRLLQRPPERTTLTAIPDYPDPPTPEEAAASMVAASSAANAATASGSHEPTASGPVGTNSTVVHVAVVLYDAVAREIRSDRNYTVSRVMKSAEVAGILQRYGWTHRAFIAAVTSKASWDPESNACLRFRGTLPNGDASTATYQRTAAPVPMHWTALVSDEELRRFIDAFRSFVATRPVATR